MLNPIRTTVLGAAMILAAACDSAPDAAPLADRVFVSQRVLEGDRDRALVDGTVLRLSFLDAQRLSAASGCNSGRTDYEVVDDRLRVDAWAITTIGCSAEAHAQEDWYFFEVLGADPVLTLDGDALTLERGDLRIEYLDQEVATPDTELVGAVWEVDTLVRGEVASTSLWPQRATLTFGDDGMVEVFTGCNTGRAGYALDGAQVTFSDLLITEEGCAMESVELEDTVTAVVGSAGPVQWEVTVDRLSLTAGDRGLGLARVAS